MYALQGEGIAGRPEIIDVMDTSTDTDDLQAKPTHQNIIRLAPPLVITEKEIETALAIIKEAIEELPNLKGRREEEVLPDGERNVHIGVDN